MAIDFRAIERLPDGAVWFFLTFTRFEFALKDCRYVLADRHDGAKADWNRFAGELGAEFLERVRASGRAATLVARPLVVGVAFLRIL